MDRPFNNSKILASTWFALIPSSALKRDRIKKIKLFDREIILFKSGDGETFALDNRCAHLGADLSLGCISGRTIQCAFHHWTYDGEGQCLKIPSQSAIPDSAKVFSYPVQEKYGYVWIFNGRKPTFPVPYFADEKTQPVCVFHLPQMTFHCHPNICTVNGLDIEHMRCLHHMKFLQDPQLQRIDDFRVAVNYKMAFNGTSVMDRFVSYWMKDFEMQFMTWGGNMSTGEVFHPRFPIKMVFNHTLQADGSTVCRTFFLMNKGAQAPWDLWKLPLLFIIMQHFLIDDMELFNSIRFWPRLVQCDEPLRLFMDVVNQEEHFHPHKNYGAMI